MPAAIRLIVGCNAAWVVASIALLASGLVSPTPFGYVFVLVQAIAVAVFAEAQWLGLRRVTALSPGRVGAG